MNLSVGIVGLPNVGKSTLFNALLKRQQAYVANFPFATIEPNVGVVPVPDARLSKLAEVVKNSDNIQTLPPAVPAIVEFVDIAGLIAGASKGEGLGNKFLSHIRETSAICHVIRVFSDPSVVKEGTVNPQSDFEVIETELALSDLQTLEKQKDPGNTTDKELKRNWEIIVKFREALEKGTPIRKLELKEDEVKLSKMLGLLTAKPILVVLNVDEDDLKRSDEVASYFAERLKVDDDQVVCISAKTESELAGLSEDDQKEYLSVLGTKESGLERLIKKAFSSLGLINFLTAGVKEVRAWTIKKGTNAQDASGEIHSDFVKNFIRADVVPFDDFVSFGGWKNCRQEGKVRSEGRDYTVQDGDVIEFLIGRG
jgi:GTP-binding protein YchF